MEWSISFTSWLWIIFTVCLFLFVVYLTATNQLADFLKLIGLVFMCVGGVVAAAGIYVGAVLLSISPILVIVAGVCLIIKWIFF